jgi:hypothetical protein
MMAGYKMMPISLNDTTFGVHPAHARHKWCLNIQWEIFPALTVSYQ